MLSVLIETENDEEALARSLASLVSAAVEGMVREVIVLDRGSTDATQRVADHAGCVFLQGGNLVGAVGQARGDWLVLIEPGARLGEGWTQAVREHVASQATPARFTPLRKRPSWWRGGWRRVWARRGLEGGLLIAKAEALPLLAAGGDGQALARRVRARRLDASIVAAG